MKISLSSFDIVCYTEDKYRDGKQWSLSSRHDDN